MIAALAPQLSIDLSRLPSPCDGGFCRRGPQRAGAQDIASTHCRGLQTYALLFYRPQEVLLSGRAHGTCRPFPGGQSHLLSSAFGYHGQHSLRKTTLRLNQVTALIGEMTAHKRLASHGLASLWGCRSYMPPRAASKQNLLDH